MVETGEDLRFSLEPCEAIRTFCEGFGQDLQRNLAVQLGISGLIDLAHAALTDEGVYVGSGRVENRLPEP